jgi:hydroxyethylthiazole kinase-like uncharacterized protein yjeF
MPVRVKNNPDLALNLVEHKDLIFPSLAEDDNKYTAGTLFLLAGSSGMTGAASLAALAALRTGIGLLNIGIPQSLNPIMEVKITEGLTIPLPETDQSTISLKALPIIRDRIEWADSIIIGPGSGRDKETLQVLTESIRYCHELKKPTLIDADALFALSLNTDLITSLGSNFILTPHHGEFKRLSSFTKEEIRYEPWRCLQDYLKDKSFLINLKGAPSIVGSADGQIYINPTGNAGLAKGGSGDVLSGIIGGLMGRGISPLDAAITGNYIHGEAADMLLTAMGINSMLPSDLIEMLPQIFEMLI